MEKQTNLQILFRPDWHPEISSVLGDIRGQFGVVTENGTIKLLGPIHENPDITEENLETKHSGPKILASAIGGLFL